MYSSKRPPEPRRERTSKTSAGDDPCAVRVDDLAHLDAVQGILRLLNEPRQSAAPLAELVGKLPRLTARLRRAYRPAQWYTEDAYGQASVTTMLVMMGNRAFEALLLEYLEDLTMLKGEIEEANEKKTENEPG